MINLGNLLFHLTSEEIDCLFLLFQFRRKIFEIMLVLLGFLLCRKTSRLA